MSEKTSVLIVEDDLPLRESIGKFLTRHFYHIQAAASVVEAAEAMNREGIDLVLVDLTLPDGNGLELVERFGTTYSNRIIVLTGTGSIEKAVQAIKNGAFDFLEKPVNPEILLLTLRKAEELQQTRRDLERLRREVSDGTGFAKFVYKSRIMSQLIELAKVYAASDQPVLITGETGTGKELMAQAVQLCSPRAGSPFLSVNCASIPETLAESELFGYKQGAFTGAVKSYPGKFVLADKGTLLLDEISEMPLSIQAKLLRVLESGEVTPLKGTQAANVDVRIIASANRNLEEEVQRQKFRTDLYYRIDGLNLHIPPLRERREDILPLAQHFLAVAALANGKQLDEINPEVAEIMFHYNWPGNVRELKNIIFRIAVTIRERTIRPEHLPLGLLQNRIQSPIPPSQTLAEMERLHITQTVTAVRANINRAAKLLGISRSSLYRKLKEYGIQHRDRR